MAEKNSFSNLDPDSISKLKKMYFLYAGKFSIKVIADGEIPSEYKGYVDEILKAYKGTKKQKVNAVAFFFAYTENTLQKCYISKSGKKNSAFQRTAEMDIDIEVEAIPTTEDRQGSFDSSKYSVDLLYYVFEEYLKKTDYALLTCMEKTIRECVKSNRSVYMNEHLNTFKNMYDDDTLRDHKDRLIRSLVLQSEIGFFIRLFSFNSDFYFNDAVRITEESQTVRKIYYEKIKKESFKTEEELESFQTTSKNLCQCLRDFEMRNHKNIYKGLVQCAEDSLITYMRTCLDREQFQKYDKYTLFTIYTNGDVKGSIIPPCRLCSTHLNSDICKALVEGTRSYTFCYYNGWKDEHLFQMSTKYV